MKEKIEKVYTNIQNLQLQPTKHNTMLIADCLLLLEDIYREAGSCQQPASEELDPVIRVEETEEEGEHGEDGE